LDLELGARRERFHSTILFQQTEGRRRSFVQLYAATRHDIQRRNRRTKLVFSAGSASSALIVVARNVSAVTDATLERKGREGRSEMPFFFAPFAASAFDRDIR
jgi:hypothetical protein